jgi:hypothetical protein
MDDQLAFFFGAKEIERSLGVSLGFAQARLRELCASGEVRSWGEPYSMLNGEPQSEGPSKRIEPSEWRQRDFDLTTDSDGCKFFVNVSKADLEYWLNNNRKKAVGKKPKPASKLPRDVAKQAINALWANGIPDTLTNGRLVKQVGDWLKQRNVRDISRETILRAAGRRK